MPMVKLHSESTAQELADLGVDGGTPELGGLTVDDTPTTLGRLSGP